MPVQEPKKFLQIGVFRGKQSLDDRVIQKRSTVSVGQDDSNTFCILSSAVPKKWDLFEYDQAKDSYTLCIKRESMHGRVVLKENVSLTLDETLKARDGVSIVGDEVHIKLNNASRGRIEIGKIKILFKFVSKHDELAAAKLRYEAPSAWSKLSELFPRALVIALIFSFLVHVVPLIVIGVQDWPREDDFYVITALLKPVEIQEMEIDEEKEEEPEQEIIEDSDNVLQEIQAEPEPEPEPGTVSREELMDQITDKHREQGAMITAQILGVDGGVEGFYADMLGNNAHIADMSDIAAGDIGASASGGLLNQLAASGSGGSGLLGLDNSGNSGPKVVVDNKKNETKRAQVSFKVNEKSEFTASAAPGSKESIESVFKKKQGDIKSCYQRVMNAQGKAAGRLVIVITVTKDGTVMKVDKQEDQIGGEMFTCVRQRIMNWKFGALKAPITFKKTWVFS